MAGRRDAESGPLKRQPATRTLAGPPEAHAKLVAYVQALRAQGYRIELKYTPPGGRETLNL